MQAAGIKYKEFIGNERALLKYTNEFAMCSPISQSSLVAFTYNLHRTHMRSDFSGLQIKRFERGHARLDHCWILRNDTFI